MTTTRTTDSAAMTAAEFRCLTEHLGLDQRARVMVKIENGTWKYQP